MHTYFPCVQEIANSITFLMTFEGQREYIFIHKKNIHHFTSHQFIKPLSFIIMVPGITVKKLSGTECAQEQQLLGPCRRKINHYPKDS